MLSLYQIKELLNPNRESEPEDDFRVINSWAEYDDNTTVSPENRNLEYLCYELEVMNPDTGKITHLYKAIKFARVIRLPANAKQSTAFMDMQQDVLAGVYENGFNFITVIANIIKPVALGLLFLYGVQGVSKDLEEAKKICHNDFLGFIGMMQGTFRVLELKNVEAQETEWLREKMYNMDYLTMTRGIPFANKAGEDAGNRGMGGSNVNPDSEGTLEEIIEGMADYEYVIEILSTPVYMDTLTGWQRRSQKEMTEWYSHLQGQSSLSFNLSIPMMYMANASQSQGWSKAYTDASTVSHAQGESFSVSQGQSIGESLSQSYGQSVGHSEGSNMSTSISHGISTSQGVSYGQTVGHTVGATHSEGTGHSVGAGQNMGISANSGTSSNVSQNMGQSTGHSSNESLSQSQSQNISEGHNTSISNGLSHGTSYNVSHGESTGSSHNIGQSHNIGTSENVGTSQNLSSSVSHNSSTSQSSGRSDTFSNGDSWGGSTNHSDSRSESFSDTHTDGTSHSDNQGASGGASLLGLVSVNTNGGESDGTSHSDSSGHTDGSGSSDGYATNWGGSSSESHGTSSSTSVSNGTSVSQSQSMGYNHSVGKNESYGSNESYGVSNSQSFSEGYGANESVSQTQSSGQSVSLSNGTTAGHSYGVGTNVGSSYSVGQGFGVNSSVGQSAGVSVNASDSTNASDSVSISDSVSNSVSKNYSVSQSETIGQSVGKSISDSVTESASKGYGQTASQTQGVSNGNSYTLSNGTSQGTSQGTTGTSTLGTSSSMGLGPSIGYSKSHQWMDQGVKDLLELMEYQNERIKKALRGQGAFYTYVYIACPSSDALSTAQALAKSTWQNDYAMIQPIQVLDLTETEQKHLLYHFAAFSADVTKEDVYGVEEYKYCTVLLPEEFVAYTHLPRVSEGGVFSIVQDIPKFSVPSMLKGEIYMGTILNPERYTFKNGYRTQFDYRVAEDCLLHGWFTGASRSGKTVAATRFIAELSRIRRKKTGKRMRIVVMDPKQDWRVLARFVDVDRFKFYSMGNVNFRPIKINPWKIPKGVFPQIWIDGIIDIYCRAYGLLERGKQMIADVVYELYEEAGVFEACNYENWRERVSELSQAVNFTNVYKKMEEKKVELENPNNARGRAGNDTRDAYARLLDRLSCFNREYSIERQLYGTSEGVGIDELIGDDDITVLESKGLENTFKNFIFGAVTSGFYKYALAHEGGYLAEDQYETVLVIEEANEVLTGNDAAGSGGGNQLGMSGQSEFEQILDQAAGYGLFIFAITQKIADMPSSIIANSGLVFAGRLKRPDDINVVVRAIGREERIDDRDVVKWFPRCPTGYFVCQTSRTSDFKDAEPILVQISRLNINPPSNIELDEILESRRINEYIVA